MQTIGTLYFLSLKDKRPVSIRHERKSHGTNSKTLKKIYSEYVLGRLQ